MMQTATERRFTFTYDNPRGGDYSRPARDLGRLGTIDIVRFPRTLLRLTPRSDVSFNQIKLVAARVVDPSRGSAILFSAQTGREYRLNNRGNRPGQFVHE